MKINSRAIHEKIDSVTLSLLKRHGVKGWNMETVCRSSGVAKDTLYRMIGSKEKLIRRVLLNLLEEHSRNMAAIVDTSTDITGALKSSASLLHGLFETMPPENLTEILIQFPSLEGDIKTSMASFFRTMANFIDTQKTKGAIKKNVDAGLVIDIIHAVVMEQVRQPGRPAPQGSLDTCMEYLTGGIKA